MPIRLENRDRYPKDWPEISRRVRAEAGNKCEWCGVENHSFVVRDEQGEVLYATTTPDMQLETLTVVDGYKATRIVLTVAHLNHTPEDCSRENLAALCQKCHLNYDRHLHVNNRRKSKIEAIERAGQLVFSVIKGGKL